MFLEKKKIYLETREKLKALNHAFVVISWDSETEAPAQALDKRSEIIGTLSGMYNDLLFDNAYVEAVNYLYNNPDKWKCPRGCPKGLIWPAGGGYGRPRRRRRRRTEGAER